MEDHLSKPTNSIAGHLLCFLYSYVIFLIFLTIIAIPIFVFWVDTYWQLIAISTAVPPLFTALMVATCDVTFKHLSPFIFIKLNKKLLITSAFLIPIFSVIAAFGIKALSGNNDMLIFVIPSVSAACGLLITKLFDK